MYEARKDENEENLRPSLPGGKISQSGVSALTCANGDFFLLFRFVSSFASCCGFVILLVATKAREIDPDTKTLIFFSASAEERR
jgi:hypothetical protein